MALIITDHKTNKEIPLSDMLPCDLCQCFFHESELTPVYDELENKFEVCDDCKRIAEKS